VDGSSGGFVAPFASPKLEWDFKIPRVVSINTSGHKFGLAYVGVGWIIWRSAKYLPKDLIFELHYLGSVEYSFSLNFSRPAHPIIAQYFNFLSLGFEGYRNIALSDLKNARTLSRALEKTGFFTVLSDIHRPKSSHSGDENDVEQYEEGLPVVAFRFSDDFQKKHPDIRQKWVQTLLRTKGWIVPNYDLAPDLSQVDILRVVVKENFTEALLDRLLTDLVDITEDLANQDSPTHALTALGKSHGPGSHEKAHGRVEEHEVEGGAKQIGVYSKTC
jgi:glutamate decarboxylase